MSNQSLVQALAEATGPSRQLDERIAREWSVATKDYTASVDACLGLLHDKLPKAHWHVGRAADGVSIYATVNAGRTRAESTSGTVPLALLAAMAQVFTS